MEPSPGQILGHKSSLGKFKKIEIILSIFSDHNAVRLDLNYRRKTIKNSNIHTNSSKRNTLENFRTWVQNKVIQEIVKTHWSDC